jgi:hypothetical protein
MCLENLRVVNWDADQFADFSKLVQTQSQQHQTHHLQYNADDMDFHPLEFEAVG